MAAVAARWAPSRRPSNHPPSKPCQVTAKRRGFEIKDLRAVSPVRYSAKADCARDQYWNRAANSLHDGEGQEEELGEHYNGGQG